MITNLIAILAKITIYIISHTGYGGIFILMLVESCGIPAPSEVIMPFSGFLVYSGQMNFWIVAIIGAFGNLAGSWLAYWIGAMGGRTLIERYGKYALISERDLNLADRWFSKYGDWTVFFGRLLPIVRTYISFPAGIAKMNFKRFSFFTFLGALPWSIAFTWLGVKMGSRWDQIQKTLHNFDLLMLILVIAAIAWYVWRHLKRKNNSPRA